MAIIYRLGQKQILKFHLEFSKYVLKHLRDSADMCRSTIAADVRDRHYTKMYLKPMEIEKAGIESYLESGYPVFKSGEDEVRY